MDNHQLMLKKLQEEFMALGIADMGEVPPLVELDGAYINLQCKLPNGCYGQILDDGKTYWGAQAHKLGSDRCYGLAGDESQLAVYEYGCNGADAKLVLWKRR